MPTNIRTPEQIELDAIEAFRAGASVSMRQARLALNEVGMLSQINAAIASLPDDERAVAEIEWEYGSVVERKSEWVIDITGALGMTPEQVDDLFRLAATK
jgi:hypothetical protein